MDQLNLSDCKLYFEDPLPAEAERLIGEAVSAYEDQGTELSLLRVHLMAPENLTVLVGLYRYYVYQQRLPEAMQVAERAMQLAARQLGLPTDWQQIDQFSLGTAARISFGLLRFYLLALKAVSVVLLRLGCIAASQARLRKLASLDQRDHLGAARLLAVLDQFQPRPASAEAAFAFTPA